MIEILNDKKILFHSFYDQKLWASNKREILSSDDFGNTWNKVAKVDKLPILSNITIYNRLTRNGISNIININPEMYAVIIKKQILIYSNEKLVKTFNISRGSRPIRQCIFCKEDGSLIYGDYWDNAEREPANIYNINTKTMTREILVSISNTRHIHFVQQSKLDPETIYIGTGDEDKESNIYTFNIKNNKLKKIGGGSQDWRAVSLVQRDNIIYWGTDAPDEQNSIFKFDLQTKTLRKVHEVSGPVFYSAENSTGVLMVATIVEYKGKHQAKIYASKNGENWYEIKEWKKDFLPQFLFGFGVIDFIKGQENLERIYINTHGLI